MSRTVPMDRALTDADRTHLRYLGAAGTALEKRLDAQFPPDPQALDEFNRKERLQRMQANGQAAEQQALVDENQYLLEQLAAAREQIAALQEGKADDAGSKVPDYSGKEWTKAALEAEVERINAEDPEAKLAKGTKEEMAKALTAYFAEE